MFLLSRMKLLGFNFTKISGERYSTELKDLKINTKVDITDITEAKSEFLNKNESFLTIQFEFLLDYSPKFAKVLLEGSILVSLDSKTGKEALESWKDKKVLDSLGLSFINAIIRKSTLRALEIEEELGLPLHMQLPSIRKEDKEE